MKKDKNTQEHKNKETFSNETENKNGAKIANQKLFRQKGFITKMKKKKNKRLRLFMLFQIESQCT